MKNVRSDAAPGRSVGSVDRCRPGASVPSATTGPVSGSAGSGDDCTGGTVADLLARAADLAAALGLLAAEGTGGPRAAEGIALGALGVEGTLTTDAMRVDLIAGLETLKAAACAAQARAAAEFATSQRSQQRAVGVPAERCGRGVAAQIALARAESHHQGGRLLGFAEALSKEMPCTMRALAAGAINEWRATVLVRESACLSVEDRAALDDEVCGDPAALRGVGTRALAGRARRVAARLDAAALVERARRAESERCVTIRPAQDQMVYLTALLPMKPGIAAYAALKLAGDQSVATGDETSRGRAMADTLVARVTGRAPTEPVPVNVGLVMTETALLAPGGLPGAEEPALVETLGTTVPAAWARALVTQAAGSDAAHSATGADSDVAGSRSAGPEAAGSGAAVSDGARTALWLRRLFTNPETGELAAMDSRSRVAPPGLARFIRYRDQRCATPWCDAPIRHVDHIVPAVGGGPTSADNLQGLCEACNHAKQAPGWSQQAGRSTRASRSQEAMRSGHAEPSMRTERTELGPLAALPPFADQPDPGLARWRVETLTPTGHRYLSTPPPLPGAHPEPAHAHPDRARTRLHSTRTHRDMSHHLDVAAARTISQLEVYLEETLHHPLRQ